jgi:transposase
VVRRKAEVVAAVNGGLLSIDEVCERYNLTLEEFASWQRAVDRSGMQGLRVTRIQHYRDLYERQQKYGSRRARATAARQTRAPAVTAGALLHAIWPSRS